MLIVGSTHTFYSKRNKRNMIVGCLYRHPTSHTTLKQFNEDCWEPLCKIASKDKICALMGDFNIDLLKAIFYTFYFTAIRLVSKTLIGNIFLNTIQYPSHRQSHNTTIRPPFPISRFSRILQRSGTKKNQLHDKFNGALKKELKLKSKPWINHVIHSLVRKRDKLYFTNSPSLTMPSHCIININKFKIFSSH